MKTRSASFTLALAAAFVALAADAQAPAIKRTMLQRTDIGDNREAVQAIAEVPPGMGAGRHTHPGIEMSYVIEGSATLYVDGEPPRVVKAGDSFTIPAGKVHDAKTLGDAPVKVMATYLVEKGKPLATPAP